MSPDSFYLVIVTTGKFIIADVAYITFLLGNAEREQQCCFRSEIVEGKHVQFSQSPNLNAN